MVAAVGVLGGVQHAACLSTFASRIRLLTCLPPDFALACGQPVAWRRGQHVGGAAASGEKEVRASGSRVVHEKRALHRESATVVGNSPTLPESRTSKGLCTECSGVAEERSGKEWPGVPAALEESSRKVQKASSHGALQTGREHVRIPAGRWKKVPGRFRMQAVRSVRCCCECCSWSEWPVHRS